jgi:low temperature requirement protein LtrA
MRSQRHLRDPSSVSAAEVEPVETERGISPVELLWDLVFVFAITQVTTLLGHELSWAGVGRSMLALALVWWAWSAFVWAANAQESSSPVLRGTLLLATCIIFLTGLALPRAFAGEGTLFAVSYALVRLLHLALYAHASRQGNASWAAIAGFAVTVVVGMVLLVAGSFTHGTVRIALWAVAVAIDYSGPAWLTRERLRGLQRVAVAHFAERYSTFVIICLGESIVAIGVGASSAGHRLSFALAAAVLLGLLIAIGMWWTYFHRQAAMAEEQLRKHHDPVLAAADAYSYLHLVIVAGIIVFAVGVRLLARGDVTAPLTGPVRLALCAGVALYLLGNIGFRLRMVGDPGYERGGIAIAALLLYALGADLPGWAVAAILASLLAALGAAETASANRAERDAGTAVASPVAENVID